MDKEDWAIDILRNGHIFVFISEENKIFYLEELRTKHPRSFNHNNFNIGRNTWITEISPVGKIAYKYVTRYESFEEWKIRKSREI